MEKPNVTGLEKAAGVPEDVAAGEQPIKIEPPPGEGEVPGALEGSPDKPEASAPEAPETKPIVESRTESGGFLRNIVDRVKLWREKAHAGKQEDQVKALTAKREAEEKKAAEAKKAEGKLKDDIQKAEEDFKKVTGESRDADLGPAMKEIEVFQKKSEAALERVRGFEEKIEGTKEKVDDYKEKVEEVTGRIDGRLLAKQEKNNETADKLKIQRDGLDEQVKMYDAEIDKLNDQKKQLEDGLGEQSNKKIREVYQKKILEIQKMVQGVEKLKNKFVEKRDLAASKIKALEGDNKNLQSKREELRPELKKKGGAPAEAGGQAAPAEAAQPEAAAPATAEPTPVAVPEAPTETAPTESRAEASGTRALELRILDLEEEKERLEAMDLTEMAAKAAVLTPAQKKAAKVMMKTGKYEMPKGTPESEAAGAELNRIFQRIPQVNKELADLRRQLKRAQLGGENPPLTKGRRGGVKSPEVAPVTPATSEVPLEVPENLPIVEESSGEEPAPEKPAEVPPVVEAPVAPEKSSEDMKKEILEKIEKDAGDKNLQETVDSSHRMFFDDDFENKEIKGIQEKMDLFKKVGKEDFLKQLDIEVDPGKLDDADFEELRGALLKRFAKWKELAEKSLKENPNPRPEKKVTLPPELEQPAEPTAEEPQPTEPVAEASVDEDALKSIMEDVAATEKKS